MKKNLSSSVRIGYLLLLGCGALMLGCRTHIKTEEKVEEFKFDNLKKLNSGFRNMHSDARAHSYPVDIKDKDGKPLLSWRVAVLPFLGEQQLYSKFKLDEPWDSPHNKKLIDSIPEVYRIPGAKRHGSKTRLMVAVGPGTPHEKMTKFTINAITDKVEHTLMAVEAGPDKAIEWSKPGDLEFNPAAPWECLGNISNKGLPAVFYDGTAMYIREDLSDATLTALFQCADGAAIDVKSLRKD